MTSLVCGRTAAAVAVLAAAVAIVAGSGCGSRSGPTAPAGRPSVVLYCATDRGDRRGPDRPVRKGKRRPRRAQVRHGGRQIGGPGQEIRQEKSRPQCDVFWCGGSFFCTILEKDGCLSPVPVDLLAVHGGALRDPQGRWLGFAAVTARSHHKGGVNASLMDGSVRWFADTTNPGVWQALSTRAGQELLPSSY